jgi:glycosyltransferase involved in cell wall biosynthesis
VTESSTQGAAPVSVVIPCFRCKDTIRQALDSALYQTLPPAEVLLVDDGSDDGTLALLRTLAEAHALKVRVIAMSKNGGPGAARNAGWDAAAQPWIAFLDADDVWHPRKLEIQWTWIASNPQVALCGHGSRYAPDGCVDSAPKELLATSLTPKQMLISNRLPTRSVMLRRDLPQRFAGREVTEDYLLWLEIIFAGYQAYRLEGCLAYSLRPDYSPGGYSSNLWLHEKRELAALRLLQRSGAISPFAWGFWSAWSFVKYLRRATRMLSGR